MAKKKGKNVSSQKSKDESSKQADNSNADIGAAHQAATVAAAAASHQQRLSPADDSSAAVDATPPIPIKIERAEGIFLLNLARKI